MSEIFADMHELSLGIHEMTLGNRKHLIVRSAYTIAYARLMHGRTDATHRHHGTSDKQLTIEKTLNYFFIVKAWIFRTTSRYLFIACTDRLDSGFILKLIFDLYGERVFKISFRCLVSEKKTVKVWGARY